MNTSVGLIERYEENDREGQREREEKKRRGKRMRKRKRRKQNRNRRLDEFAVISDHIHPQRGLQTKEKAWQRSELETFRRKEVKRMRERQSDGD